MAGHSHPLTPPHSHAHATQRRPDNGAVVGPRNIIILKKHCCTALTPHDRAVLQTLLELWHAVDKANRHKTKGLARIMCSMSGSHDAKVAATLNRLDDKLQRQLAHLSTQLLISHGAGDEV
jgi:hypothetical protein